MFFTSMVNRRVKMSKKITAYRVTNLSKVNTTLYKNGDIFYTDRSIGVLHNGKVKTIGQTPDLSDYGKIDEVEAMIADVSDNDKKEDIRDVSDYAKKEDIPDVSDYAKKEDIPDVSSFVTSEQVQQMIDNALDTGGEESE